MKKLKNILLSCLGLIVVFFMILLIGGLINHKFIANISYTIGYIIGSALKLMHL
jgi:hypothetical protein